MSAALDEAKFSNGDDAKAFADRLEAVSESAVAIMCGRLLLANAELELQQVGFDGL